LKACIERGRLGVEPAIQLTLDLLGTMKVALVHQIVHRDLKPSNIVMRSIDPLDAVIVDYGLSFNAAEQQDISRPSETLDNSFLSLPERRVPGGDRRDPRSDLTGICGILYFALTGHRPVDLADSSGRPPHRRVGHSLRDVLAEDSRLHALETLLDRGFSTIIDHRFQTADELHARLLEVVSPQLRRSEESPAEFAKKSATRLLAGNRKAQIASYRQHGQKLLADISKMRSKAVAPGIAPYRVEDVGIAHPDWPPQTEQLELVVAWRVGLPYVRNSMILAYCISVQGTECVVFRRTYQSAGVKHTEWQPASEWTPVLRFTPGANEDVAGLKADVSAGIRECMAALELAAGASNPIP